MVTEALTGVTVIDFTRFVSGSYSTLLLASLGAEVVKIERLPDGDPYRVTGARDDGGSALFDCLNSGKSSVAIDFDEESDRRFLDSLIAGADVFVENSRPGSLDRHGLDPESLRRKYPSLVYASISAFGDAGPARTRGGFDLVLQAETGVMSVTGDPASGPAKMGLPFLDIGAGVGCLAAILAALIERTRTGKGARVTSSLFEFGLAGFTTQVDAILRDGATPGLLGSHSPSFAPYGSFRCADRSIILAGSGSEELWARLCTVLGEEALLDDERFRTNGDRLEHRAELTHAIERALMRAPADHWLERLEAAGVPAGEVRSARDALLSDQSRALGSVYENGAAGSSYWNVAAPFRIGQEPLVGRSPAPALGADNDRLAGRLGETKPQ